MPLAEDSELGTGKENSVLNAIMRALRQTPENKAYIAARGAQNLELRQDGVQAELAAKAALPKQDGVTFNPEAMLDTSRVIDIGAPEQQMFKQTAPIPERKFGLVAKPEAEAEIPLPPKQTPALKDIAQRAADFHKPGMAGMPKTMVAPGQSAMVDQKVIDELGMKTGALTTVEYEPGKSIEEAALEQAARGAGPAPYGQRIGTGDTSTPSGYSVEDKERSAANAAAEIQAVEEDVADQQARGRRTQRKAINLGAGRNRTETLTSEEYAKLSPREKAAVDLNTLLVTAVQEDLANRKKGVDSAKQGGKEYDAKVAEVFGEKGAAKAPYAPQTMKLLDDMDFSVDGAKLDDILKLKVGMTETDIQGIGKDRGSKDASLATPEHTRTTLNEALVKAFRKQRTDPTTKNALLETQRDLLATRERFDFGSPENNQLVEAVYEMMANPDREHSIDQIMAQAKATLSDEHWPMFMQFLDVRSREALQYDRPLGVNDAEVDYLPAKAFRRKTGL